jgi:hypothetical protein
MTVYIQALKKFNEGKKYIIPKKLERTDDCNSVMQIMRTLQSEKPKKEPKPKRERKKKTSLP